VVVLPSPARIPAFALVRRTPALMELNASLLCAASILLTLALMKRICKFAKIWVPVVAKTSSFWNHARFSFNVVTRRLLSDNPPMIVLFNK
jgi:hypothetical protein